MNALHSLYNISISLLKKVKILLIVFVCFSLSFLTWVLTSQFAENKSVVAKRHFSFALPISTTRDMGWRF